jgi:hypothetical protein
MNREALEAIRSEMAAGFLRARRMRRKRVLPTDRSRARRLEVAERFGAPLSCAHGHPRSEFIRQANKRGEFLRWRCLVCQPAGAEVRR